MHYVKLYRGNKHAWARSRTVLGTLATSESSLPGALRDVYIKTAHAIHHRLEII